MADFARTFATAPGTTGGANLHGLRLALDGFPAVEPKMWGALVRPTNIGQIGAIVATTADLANARGRRLRMDTNGAVNDYDETAGGEQQTNKVLRVSEWFYVVGGSNRQAAPWTSHYSVYDFAAATQGWSHQTVTGPTSGAARGAANTGGVFMLGQSRYDMAGSVLEAFVGQIAVAWAAAQEFSTAQLEALIVAGQARRSAMLALLTGAASPHAWELVANSLAAVTDLIGNADELATGGRVGTSVYSPGAGLVPYLTSDPVTTFLDADPITARGGSETPGAGTLGVDFTVSPAALHFATRQGQQPGTQELVITGPDQQVVAITDNAAWLFVEHVDLGTPVSQVTIAGGEARVRVRADLAALAAGATGAGVITLNAAGTVKTVAVDYVVTAAPADQGPPPDEPAPPPPGPVGLVNVIAERAVGLLRAAGMLSVDATHDRLLEGIVRGVLGPALPLSLAAHGANGSGAWRMFTDPAWARLEDLPYAAQWTGATVPPRLGGEDTDAYLARARVEMRRPRGWYRGSPESLLDVAQPYIVGDAHLVARIVQRAGNSIWSAQLLAEPAAITSVAALEAALNDPDVIVAGVRITVNAAPVTTWDEVSGTWNAQTGTWNAP